MEALIAAVLGLFGGFVGAWGKSWLDRRFAIDERLMTRRAELYAELWRMTGRLPLYPPNPGFTREEAAALMHKLKTWYFEDGGGLYMSARTQRRYLDFQGGLDAYWRLPEDGDAAQAYESARKLGSLLRSAMTADLSSRSGPRAV